MVRRLKEESDIKDPKTRYYRKRIKIDPDWHEKQKQRNKDYYKRTKSRQQISKKLKTKEQREFAIKKLGNACMSCNEPYNPNTRVSNLQFDHKFYLKSKHLKTETLRNILDMIESGEDPKKQFALLCRTCHMIVTYLRKDTRKSMSTLDYIKKNKILSKF